MKTTIDLPEELVFEAKRTALARKTRWGEETR